MKHDIRDISNAFIIISDVPHTSIPQQTVTIKPLMGNAVEDSSVLIIPIVRYSKKSTTIKWDLNAKKAVPGNLYGKKKKTLNGHYVNKKPNHLLLRTFLGGYFQMMYLNINLNINKYMYIMIRQTF